MERYQSKMMTLYKELTHSNLEGNIPYGSNIRNLYVIYCLDQIFSHTDLDIPEYAYGGFVKEISRIQEECSDHFIDGEDHSSISLYSLSEAFLAYFLESHMQFYRKSIKSAPMSLQKPSYDILNDISEDSYHK